MPSYALHRIIITAYCVLTLAALGRSSFQIVTKFDEAPLAYSLSLVAAVVYVIATVSLATSRIPLARRVAGASLTLELVGVVIVGILSFAIPDLFPDQTVWSHFGAGYLFIPLVLPAVGLWWLSRHRVAV